MTKFYFSGSLDRFIHPDVLMLSEAYFKGTVKEYEGTNLQDHLGLTDIYCLDESGEYYCAVPNRTIGLKVFEKAQEAFANLVNEKIPGNNPLRGSGVIEFPKTLSLDIDGKNVVVPLTITSDTADMTSAILSMVTDRRENKTEGENVIERGKNGIFSCR